MAPFSVQARRSDGRSATQLNGEISVVRSMVSTADDSAIRTSLEQDRHDPFPGWTGRWLQKCDRPIPKTLPIDELGFLERVLPSSAKAIGAEFDNCPGRDPERVLSLTMSGVFALLAWRHAGLLIEIGMLDDGTWMTRRIHARSNAAVTRTMRLQVRAALEPLGVKVPIPATPPPEVGVVLCELGVWRTPFADLLNAE